MAKPLKRGPTPFYHQIRAIFREKIENGELRPGERFPSEDELCRSFQVSRATVRQALQGLEQSDLITREPGRGSFVRATPGKVAQLKMTCLLEDLIALGIPAETKVTDVGVLKSSAAVADGLMIARGEDVFSFVRVISVDDQPFAATRVYLPLWMGQKLTREDLEAQNLLETLSRRCGVNGEAADQLVQAIMADASQAGLLDVTAGSALLSVTRRTFDRDDNCIEFSVTNYRSDRTRFHISQKRRKTNPEDWVLSSRGGRAVRGEREDGKAASARKKARDSGHVGEKQ